MTTAPTIASPSAQGSNPATGRNIYVEGNRYVARFRVTLATSHVGAGTSDAFDPATYGFPYKPAEVALRWHDAPSVANNYRYVPSYDYVNKRICLWDSVDNDNGDGDTLTSPVLDVIVYSE